MILTFVFVAILFRFTSYTGVSIQLYNDFFFSSRLWAAQVSSPWGAHDRPIFIFWILIVFTFLIASLYRDVVLLWPKTENLFEVGI